MSKKILAIITIITFILTQGGPLGLGISYAANEVFNQTSWDANPSSGVTAIHPTNKTGWTKYEAKGDNTDTSQAGKIMISAVSSSKSEDTDTDFNQGSLSHTIVSGTGTAATVKLETTIDEKYVNRPQQWIGTPSQWASNGGSAFMGPPSLHYRYSKFTKIGNYIYANFAFNYWGKMDIATEEWTMLKRAPVRWGLGACFAAGDDGYIYALAGGGTKVFMRYDPNGDTWLASTSCGGTLAEPPYYITGGAAMVEQTFSTYGTQHRLYTVFGAASPNSGRTLGFYDIGTNTWKLTEPLLGDQTLATLPTSISQNDRQCALYVSGNTEHVYWMPGGVRNDWYRFSTRFNSWSPMPAQLTYRYCEGTQDTAFLTDPDTGNGYIYYWYSAGCGTATQYRGFGRICITSTPEGSWQNLANSDTACEMDFYYWGPAILYYPGSGSYYKFYYGLTNLLRPMRCDKTTLRWQWGIRRSMNGGTYGTYAIWPGGTHDYIYQYVGQSGSPTKFYRYSISTDTWDDTGAPDLLSGWGTTYAFGNNLAYYNDKIYCVVYSSTLGANRFGYYNITSPGWTEISASVPTTYPQAGGGLVFVPASVHSNNKNYLYLFQGINTQNLYRYNIDDGGAWQAVTASWPISGQNLTDGGGVVYPGTGNFIYVVQGQTQRFWKFDCSTQTWASSSSCTDIASFPSNRNYQFFSIPGQTNYVYVLHGSDAPYRPMAGFLRYSISGNSWDFLDVPQVSHYYTGCIAATSTTAYYWNIDYGSATYNVSAGTWDSSGVISDNVQAAYNGVQLIYGTSVETADAVYCFFYAEQGTNMAFVFDKTKMDWTKIIRVPFRMFCGTVATRAPGTNYIYITEGGTKHFWRYDFVNNTWTTRGQLAETPYGNFTHRHTAMDAYDANKIYAFMGYYDNHLLRYDVDANPANPGSWASTTLLATPPDGSKNQSGPRPLIAIPSKKGLFWVTEDAYTVYFYSLPDPYNPGSSGSWYRLLAGNNWPPASASYQGTNLYYPLSGGDYIYYFKADRYVMRININTGQCDNLHDLYKGVYWGLAPFMRGDNYLYLFGQGDQRPYYGRRLYKYLLTQPVSPTSKWDIPYWYINNQNVYEWTMIADPEYDKIFFTETSRAMGKFDMSSDSYQTGSYWGTNQFWPGNDASLPYTYPYTQRYFYMANAYNTNTFRRYDMDNDAWVQRANTPEVLPNRYTPCSAGTKDYIYMAKGNNSTSFWKYNISTDQWASYGAVPIGYNVANSSAMCYPGTGKYLYMIRGNNSSDFFKIKIIGDDGNYLASPQFTLLNPTPFLAGYDAINPDNASSGMCYPGVGDYIYVLPVPTLTEWWMDWNHFYRYKMSNDTWEELQGPPIEVRAKPRIVRPKNSDYLVVLGQCTGEEVGFKPAMFYLWKSGTYTSKAITLGENASYSSITWTDNSKGEIVVKARSAATSDMSGAVSWDKAAFITKGGSLTGCTSITPGHKYLQYRVYFYAYDVSDANNMPAVDKVTINYTNYPSNQYLESSKYNTTETRDRLMKLSWTETLPAGTDIRVQVKTSKDNVTWSNWYGPTGTTSIDYDFTNTADYAMSSKIKLSSGAAQLNKDLEEYAYNQPITVDNTGGSAWTDAVITLNIDKTNAAFWSHIQSDGDDIRFFDTGSSVKLAYNLLSFDYTNRTATIYIKVPSINAEEKKTIYMLYGSSTAVSESDAACIPGSIFNSTFDGTTVDTNKFVFGQGYITQDNQIAITNYLPDVWKGYLMTKNSFARVEGRSFIAKVKFDYGTLCQIGWHDSSSDQSPSYADYCFYFDNRGWYMRLYLAEKDQGKGIVISLSPYNQWYEIKITLHSAGASYYYRPVGATDWIKIGDTAQYTDSPLRPFIVTYNNVWRVYTDDWRIEDSASVAFTGPVYFSVSNATATSPSMSLAGTGTWTRRQPVTITGDTVQRTDYSVKMTVTYDADMQTDFDDIRFTSSDGTTLLKHYRESYTASTSAVFWVKVPSIPASPATQTIYMYYGNASADTASNSAGYSIPSNGLYAWYKFNEGAGTDAADSSGNNLAGTVSGATWANGKFGTALQFDGVNDYVTLPSGFANFTNGITIGVWACPTQTGSWWRFVDLGNGQSNNNIIFCRYSNQNDFDYSTFSGASQSSNIYPNTGLSIQPGQWQYFVVTESNSGAVKLYQNGQQICTGSVYVPVNITRTLNYIGKSNWSWDAYYGGLMDQMVIYNRELTAGEVAQLYKASDIMGGALGASFGSEETVSTPWNSTWSYRYPITLDNSAGGAKTNAIVSFSPTNAYTDLWTRAQSSGDDIRFVDSDNTTVLSYYLNSFDSINKTASVSVKVPSLSAGQTKTIYMYYGNSAALSASSQAATIDTTVPASGLQARWRFDEGGGTTTADISGNNNTGTLYDGPLWVDGKFGKALQFVDNNDYVLVSDSNSLTTSTAFTWSLWTYVYGPRDGCPDIALFAKDNWAGEYILGIQTQDWNRLQVRLNSQAVYSYAMTKPIPALSWQHIAVTWDGATIKAYLNGVLQNSIPYSGTITNTSSNLYIGRCAASQTYSLRGKIDEFLIYNRALSAAEVQKLAGADVSDMVVTFPYAEAANTYKTNAYYTDNPTIQPILGAFYNGNLAEFQQVPTNPPANTEIKYQVSPNGYDWYWYNAGWEIAAGGFNYANYASIISAHLDTFMTSVASTGEFTYRAYLSSTTGTATPSLDQVKVVIATADTYYLDSAGATAINAIHTDATDDQWFQYRVSLYSDGKNTPILDDLNLEYIKAYITVTSPDTHQDWLIGSSHSVTWNKDGLVNSGGSTLDENVTLEYTTDGSTWRNMAGTAGQKTTVANTGTYSWTVPDTHGTAVKVRVASKGWPVISDESNANSRIYGAVNITSPVGAERWIATTQHNITWTTPTGTIPNVKIEYSINSGGAWSPVIENEGTPNDGIVANDGSFTWTVPDSITPADTCLVRVSDSTDSETVSTSPAAFRIIGEFAVTFPTLNAALTSWAHYNVTWTTTGTISQVYLSYTVNGSTWLDMTGTAGQKTLVTNTNTYDWTVPNPLSETCLLKVEDKNDSTVSALSPNFYIRGFQVSKPNGAEEWELGYTHRIEWSSGGQRQLPIKIWLSTDGGTGFGSDPIASLGSNLGYYDWYIDPQVYSVSDTCRIKVTDSQPEGEGGPRQDTSDANFRIMPTPALAVTSPIITDEWIIGSHNITWTTTGSISSNLAIEYSVGGGTWTAVSPAPTAEQITAKSYPWTIPDIGVALPASVQVRVRETTVPTGRDTQTLVSALSAAFKITTPTITITAPTAGTTWVVGDTSRTITWTSVGTLVDNLILEYSVDGGTEWTNIATFTQAQHDGSYDWQNIPSAAAGDSVLLRISDSRSPAVVTDNSEAIKILGHVKVTLSTPTPGEILIQGDSYNITWVWDGLANTNNLSLRLSTDGGATWPSTPAYYIIGQAIPNSPATYGWTTPSSLETTTARIKIYDTTDPLVESITENFTISIPKVNITAPALNDNWFGGGTHNITWTTIGSVSKRLKIEYRLNGGSWVTITAATNDSQANAKTYPWTLPDSAGSTCEIQITDTTRAAVTDISDVFNIIAPTVTVTAPTGSETGPNAWVVGTQHNITWTNTGADYLAIGNLKIQYSSNGGSSWTTCTGADSVDPTLGTYQWTIPDAVSSNCLVKIYDPARVATTSTSNTFEIKAPSLTVTSPTLGSESWIIGTEHDITWYSVGSVTVPLKLYYTANGTTWNQIAAFDGVNDGTYTWTVPDDYSAGFAKIKIEDSYTPTARSDESDKSFIIAYPTLSVTSPTSSSLLSATETIQITWDNVGTLIGPMKVEWSTNNFVTSTTIDDDIDKAVKTCNWTIEAGAVSTSTRVRVTDMGRNSGATVWAKSNAFTVLPAPVITISAPAASHTGANAWRIGKQYTITWSDNGGKVSNDLKLQYSVNASNPSPTWVDIATGEANDGSYNWTVPTGASASSDCKIKIYDNTPWKTGTNLTATSATFEIAIPRINITSPAGGEYWAYGDSAPITWTYDGIINNNLTFQYSLDGGSTYPYVIASGETNDGTLTWSVPDVASNNAKIKITDASSNYGGQQVIATSEVFNIISVPTITVAGPNGGETYVLGDTMPITWTSRGLQVTNVKIEYSNDNFATSRTIIDSTPNDGSYNWTIPSDALSSATIKVRISMVGNASVKDESNDNLRIRGGFTISAPALNQRCIVGKSETVSWTTLGTIASVKVLYSATGAAPWTTIVASTSNAGTYSFAIPAPRVVTAIPKVRIEDATDATVYAESAAFRADYYTITWRILDSDTNTPLEQLSTTDNRNYYVDATGTLISPVIHDYPYNTYVTTWKKTGYIDRSADWTADSDKTMSVPLQNTVTATVTYQVQVTTSYSADNDILKGSAWLEKRGKLVGANELDLADLTSATFAIYDGSTLLKSISVTTPDNRGVYWFSWEKTGLTAGKTYFIKATIGYMGSDYTSGSSVDVTEAKRNLENKELMASNLAATATVQAAVASSQSSIESKVTASQASIESKVTSSQTSVEAKVAAVKTETASIYTATSSTIPAAITTAQTKIQDVVKSEILNRENTIRSGQTMVVRYRTYTGLKPVIDVYNADNALKVNDGAMAEIGTTGIYEYELKFLTSWGKGDFTLVCSETTKGTMDALTITVLKTDIEDISGQVSAVLGTTTSISGLKSVADSLNSQFSIIETALTKVGKDLVKEVKEAVSSATALESVYTQLSNVAKEIKAMGGDSGINLEKLYEVSSEKKDDLNYLKNKTQEMKAVIELNQKMVDNIANKPITQTWYEYK